MTTYLNPELLDPRPSVSAVNRMHHTEDQSRAAFRPDTAVRHRVDRGYPGGSGQCKSTSQYWPFSDLSTLGSARAGWKIFTLPSRSRCGGRSRLECHNEQAPKCQGHSQIYCAATKEPVQKGYSPKSPFQDFRCPGNIEFNIVRDSRVAFSVARPKS